MGKLLYDGWHKIEQFTAEIKGKLVKREFLHLKSAVAGIVTDTEGKIALVKQFRPALGADTYEIPAGVDDKDLTLKEIMLEEIREELEVDDVISIEHCKLVHGYYMVTGSSNAYLHFYRIKVPLQPRYKEINDAEVECVCWVDFEHFEKSVKSGKIVDPKTLMAYFILKEEQQ